jgi:hypothetical protein
VSAEETGGIGAKIWLFGIIVGMLLVTRGTDVFNKLSFS